MNSFKLIGKNGFVRLVDILPRISNSSSINCDYAIAEAARVSYYSPTNGIYDMEDNFLWNFKYEISDIPNVTPEVIMIMDDYLTEE